MFIYIKTERRITVSKVNNTRKQFTKECLFDALMILMKKKHINTISVTELTELAGVSRMAFYRNYNSILDIISDFLDSKPLGLSIDIDYTQYTLNELLILFFSYFRQHAQLIRNMIKSDLIYLLNQSFDRHLKTTFYPFLAKIGIIGPYKASFLIGGISRVLIDWMINEMMESDKEMANIIGKMIIPSACV